MQRVLMGRNRQGFSKLLMSGLQLDQSHPSGGGAHAARVEKLFSCILRDPQVSSNPSQILSISEVTRRVLECPRDAEKSPNTSSDRGAFLSFVPAYNSFKRCVCEC